MTHRDQIFFLLSFPSLEKTLCIFSIQNYGTKEAMSVLILIQKELALCERVFFLFLDQTSLLVKRISKRTLIFSNGPMKIFQFNATDYVTKEIWIPTAYLELRSKNRNYS